MLHTSIVFVYTVDTLYISHSQTFGQEVEEQVSKMEAVIQAGRSGLLEVHWPIGTPGGCGFRIPFSYGVFRMYV